MTKNNSIAFLSRLEKIKTPTMQTIAEATNNKPLMLKPVKEKASGVSRKAMNSEPKP